MRTPFTLFRNRSFLDTVGLLAVLGLFVANAFHFNIYLTFPLYRELFGGFFILLIAKYVLTILPVSRDDLQMDRMLFYLLLFPALLLVWSLVDPEVPLYGDYFLEKTSVQLGEVSLTLYVLRNAVLYLPMVVYVYLRGLNLQEIRLVVFTSVFITPLSIYAYLQSEKFAQVIISFRDVAQIGNYGVAYNTYVPYLTFSVLCGIYLLFSPASRLIKMVVLAIVAVTSMFIIFSNSRQSFLFVVMVFGTFGYFADTGGNRVKKWLVVGVTGVVVVGMLAYLVHGQVLPEEFMNRFSSVQKFAVYNNSGRADIFFEGLLLIDPFEWLMGAGLTSVITSGPHNDYLRWTQRVGFPLMIFGFLPFFVILIRSVKLARLYRKKNSLYIFFALTISFTLFHSIFGYPREEANQAVAVYLGMSLWFGAYRERVLANKI